MDGFAAGRRGHGSGGAGVHAYAHGIAALALAATGAAAIALSVTTPSPAAWTILVLGVGQSVVLGLARTLPAGYRIASATALLVAFAAAFVPGLLQATPLSAGAAITLAAAGSLPMWAVAAWRLAEARRVVSASRPS